MNERRRPYKSVFVSPEIKHQIEDSGASIIIWQDTLYENVERTEAKLDKVILANITDYLPWLKRFLGSSVLRAVYQMMAAPPCEIYEREGFYQFNDLIESYPPNPPKIKFNIKEVKSQKMKMLNIALTIWLTINTPE